MSDLIVQPQTFIGIVEPQISSRLEETICAWIRLDTATFQDKLKALRHPQSVGRITAIIQLYDEYLASPVTREALEEWLIPLQGAVNFPPDVTAFDGRLDAIMARDPSLPRLPLACLNARSYAAAVLAFKRWPAAGDLIELLEEQTRVLTRRRSALQAIRDGLRKLDLPPPEPRQPPTEAEIAHVASERADLIRYFRMQSIPRSGDGEPPPKPQIRRTRNDDLGLIAGLRKELVTASPARADFIRQRLARLEADVIKDAE